MPRCSVCETNLPNAYGGLGYFNNGSSWACEPCRDVMRKENKGQECLMCRWRVADTGSYESVVCSECSQHRTGRGQESNYTMTDCGSCGNELISVELMRCSGCGDSMCGECPGDSQYCVGCDTEYNADGFGAEDKHHKLSAKAKSAYVFPKTQKYPIGDLKHGKIALVYSTWPDNKKDAQEVRTAVFKKYPSLRKWFKDGKYEVKGAESFEAPNKVIPMRCKQCFTTTYGDEGDKDNAYCDQCWKHMKAESFEAKGKVRTMSGKPHTPRKLVKDKNIKPKEAAKRMKLESESEKINGMTLDEWLDEIDRIKDTKPHFYYSNNLLGGPKWDNGIDQFWSMGWTPQKILEAWESYEGKYVGHFDKVKAEGFEAEDDGELCAICGNENASKTLHLSHAVCDGCWGKGHSVGGISHSRDWAKAAEGFEAETFNASWEERAEIGEIVNPHAYIPRRFRQFPGYTVCQTCKDGGQGMRFYYDSKKKKMICLKCLSNSNYDAEEGFEAEGGQMCEVCHVNDDLPYDADHFKECRRCSKSVCHECWGEMEHDDKFGTVCGSCWVILDNVAQFGAEEGTFYDEGRTAAKAVFMPELKDRDSFGLMDSEYMIQFGLKPNELIAEMESGSSRYNQFSWGWSQEWDKQTMDYMLSPDSDDYSAESQVFEGYYVKKGFVQEFVHDTTDIKASLILLGAVIVGIVGASRITQMKNAETFHAPQSCNEDSDCDDGFVCVNGECMKTCTDDGDCASWQECRDDLHPTEKVCGEDKSDSDENPFADLINKGDPNVGNPNNAPAKQSEQYSMSKKVIIGGSMVGIIVIGIKTLGGMQDKERGE